MKDNPLTDGTPQGSIRKRYLGGIGYEKQYNTQSIFSMIAVCVLLFLLGTDKIAHIIVAVLGLGILIYFTIKMKNEWTNPPLEGLMRLVYLSNMISGAAQMRVPEVPTLDMLHKACAALFLFLLLVLYIPKCKK